MPFWCLYALAGIKEYWIVSLVERCLEVYRNPNHGVYLHSWRLVTGDQIDPLGAPGKKILVSGILP